MELLHVKRYRDTQMELVSALKEGPLSKSLFSIVIKTKLVEDVFVVNMERTFSCESKKKDWVWAFESASILSIKFDFLTLSWYPCYPDNTSIFRGSAKIWSFSCIPISQGGGILRFPSGSIASDPRHQAKEICQTLHHVYEVGKIY